MKLVPEDIDNELQESIQWLKENVAPWQLVLQHWLTTFNIRHKDLNNYEDKTLVNFINKWPILRHPHGYQLIFQDFQDLKFQDFNNMNVTKVCLNYDIWQQFIEIVIKHSTYNDKDEELNLMLEKLKAEDVSTGNNLFILYISFSY